ncbi:hypothetical protein [Actinoplanes sp. NPDC089786]|uniref:hypothetical protein n=1 Tax=Actinoplanes sp. NPDC089786 TaxID=3155185 RepID=UPI0034494C50
MALLPALLTAALPQVATHHLTEERLQRTIFSAARASSVEGPAVVAVRDALRHAALAAAADRDDVEVIPRS